jgi:(S)-mandelate dehydrogenase
MPPAINVADFRRLAKQRLPRMIFDYLEGGAEDETGLARNTGAFDRLRLMPFKLRDISHRTLSCELFGRAISAPLVVAPTGLNGAFWPNGDMALAKAAAKANIPFALSTASNATIEEIADGAGGDLWFQLYVIHRGLADALVARANAAGYTTLVLTVDFGVNGKRERDIRNGFAMPMRYSAKVVLDGMLHPRWSLDMLARGMPKLKNLASPTAIDTQAQAALLKRQMDTSFDFEALKALRDRWPRTLVVKGLLAPSDVERCFALGVDGVVLSNHGGRQLDHAPAPMAVLPEIMKTPPGSLLIDSGFRRGSDVIKAIASGASAVMLGRALLYGLAAAGEAGVSNVIDIFKDEIDRTMALIGCAAIAKLDSSYLDKRPL